MDRSRRFSPLMDPLILANEVAKKPGEGFIKWAGKLDWYRIFINCILPLTMFLFIAFSLRRTPSAIKVIQSN